jgi:hypothetical protein
VRVSWATRGATQQRQLVVPNVSLRGGCRHPTSGGDPAAGRRNAATFCSPPDRMTTSLGSRPAGPLRRGNPFVLEKRLRVGGLDIVARPLLRHQQSHRISHRVSRPRSRASYRTSPSAKQSILRGKCRGAVVGSVRVNALILQLMRGEQYEAGEKASIQIECPMQCRKRAAGRVRHRTCTQCRSILLRLLGLADVSTGEPENYQNHERARAVIAAYRRLLYGNAETSRA